MGLETDPPEGWSDCMEPQHEVLRVPNLTDVTAIATGSGSARALALKADGSVWTWKGVSLHGMAVNGDWTINAPQRIEGLTKAKSIGAGVDCGLAITSDDQIWEWKEEGSVASADNTRLTPPKLVEIPAPTRAAAGQ